MRLTKLTTPNKNYNFSLVVPSTRENIIVTPFSYNNLYTFSSTVENGGFSNEQSVFNFKGKFNSEVDIRIATIKIEPNTNKKIQGQPTISIENTFKRTNIDRNVKLYLNPLNETSINSSVQSYEDSGDNTYDLFLSSKINFPSGIRFVLSYNEVSSEKRPLEITNVFFGRDNLGPFGEERDIKIVGTPYTPFELTLVNEDNESILRPQNVNSYNINPPKTAGGGYNNEYGNRAIPDLDVDNSGNPTASIQGKLDLSGCYITREYFPGLKNVISTKINGSMAASGATKIIFDDLTGVEVGDQLLMNEITYGDVVKVTVINPDGDNANECTVSSSITAADDADVRFVRSTSYKLNVTSTESLGPFVPTTNPTYTINQYVDTIVTLRLSKTRTDYTISDGVTTGGSSDTTFDKKFFGRGNFSTIKPPKGSSTYVRNLSGSSTGSLSNGPQQAAVNAKNSYIKSIRYTLDGVGAKTLSILKTPEFSKYGPDSDFTNIDPLLNGGTEVEIRSISTELSSDSGKCLLNIYIEILKYGTEDVVIDLDLDNIIE